MYAHVHHPNASQAWQSCATHYFIVLQTHLCSIHVVTPISNCEGQQRSCPDFHLCSNSHDDCHKITNIPDFFSCMNVATSAWVPLTIRAAGNGSNVTSVSFISDCCSTCHPHQPYQFCFGNNIQCTYTCTYTVPFTYPAADMLTCTYVCALPITHEHKSGMYADTS